MEASSQNMDLSQYLLQKGTSESQNDRFIKEYWIPWWSAQSASEKERLSRLLTPEKTIPLQHDRSQVLLEIVRSIYASSTDIRSLIRNIMLQAKALVGADRCSLFLVHKQSHELWSAFFDLKENNAQFSEKEYDLLEDYFAPGTLHLPMDKGLAGHVAMTGELVNLADAYSDPRFNRHIDAATGYVTKTLLSFPIGGRDTNANNEEVIGVVQMVNKLAGGSFTLEDEETVRIFGIYCAVALRQALLLDEIKRSNHRNRVLLQLMSHYTSVTDEEVEALVSLTKPESGADAPLTNETSIHPPRLLAIVNKYCAQMVHFEIWNPYDVEECDTAALTLSWFTDLGLTAKFHMPTRQLARFILTIRRNYRSVPYHNWQHGFAVARCMYALAHHSAFRQKVDDAELLALMLASLGHDVDHRGRNNAYFLKVKTHALSEMYGQDSIMERHHYALTASILCEEACNVLLHVPSVTEKRVLGCIRTSIMATDLAHFFKIRQQLNDLTEASYDATKHPLLLHAVAMNCCDLNVIASPWQYARPRANFIMDEFFAQGDEEKVLGFVPPPMFDRERACVPALQLDFVDVIAEPAFRFLRQLIPSTSNIYATVMTNRSLYLKEKNDLEKKMVEK